MTKGLAIFIAVHIISAITGMIVHYKNGTMKYAKERGELFGVISIDCFIPEAVTLTLFFALVLMIIEGFSNGADTIFDYYEKRDKEFKNKEDEI